MGLVEQEALIGQGCESSAPVKMWMLECLGCLCLAQGRTSVHPCASRSCHLSRISNLQFGQGKPSMDMICHTLYLPRAASHYLTPGEFPAPGSQEPSVQGREGWLSYALCSCFFACRNPSTPIQHSRNSQWSLLVHLRWSLDELENTFVFLCPLWPIWPL